MNRAMLLTGFRNIEEDEMDKIVRVNSDEYEIVRLLGHGKGGYLIKRTKGGDYNGVEQRIP